MTTTDRYSFRLYVTGSAPNSVLAIANLTHVCQRHLPDRHEIEIIDLRRHPERALEDGIMITPTLIKLTPAPVLRIVGNLSAQTVIIANLGLK